MKVICISDTHCKHGFIPNLPEGDMIICAGDISSRGYPWEIENFLYWFNSLDYKYKILIAGNHDFYFESNKKEAKKMLKKYPTVIYLENSQKIIEGIKIYGSPVQPTFFNWAFNVDRGEPIKQIWQKIPKDTDILITHGPAFGHGDYVYFDNKHVGCVDLLKKIEQIKPKFCIAGHIHNGHGVTKNEHTTFINASVVNEEYEIAYEPIIFEI